MYPEDACFQRPRWCLTPGVGATPPPPAPCAPPRSAENRKGGNSHDFQNPAGFILIFTDSHQNKPEDFPRRASRADFAQNSIIPNPTENALNPVNTVNPVRKIPIFLRGLRGLALNPVNVVNRKRRLRGLRGLRSWNQGKPRVF